MAVSPGLRDLLTDILSPLGQIQIRNMFGGAGVYCDGVMFGLIADDALYLKADATTAADFEAEGQGPFTYEGKSKPVVMPYWRAPERLLDDPEDMLEWGRTALRVARLSTTKTKTRSQKRTRR